MYQDYTAMLLNGFTNCYNKLACPRYVPSYVKPHQKTKGSLNSDTKLVHEPYNKNLSRPHIFYQPLSDRCKFVNKVLLSYVTHF